MVAVDLSETIESYCTGTNYDSPECQASDLDNDGVLDQSDSCLGSNTESTISIDGCTSDSPNIVFSNGCTMIDLIDHCAETAQTHGNFINCVDEITQKWVQGGVIDGKSKGKIQSCAAKSDIP